MLGLIPLFFIGRYYYQLAHEHDRSRWGFAFLGVGIAIVSQLLFGFVAGILAVVTNNLQWLDSPFIITILAIAFSIALVVLVYKLLEKSWVKNPIEKSSSEFLDR